jgi:hypothetical protein
VDLETMVYFLEHDANGVIYHVASYPLATIVPLINVIELKKKDGSIIPLAEPVGIDEDTHNMLVADGFEKYTYDVTTGTVVKKAATNA